MVRVQCSLELISVAWVVIGLGNTLWLAARRRDHEPGFPRIRLCVGSWLILAQALQLAADILATTIAPSQEALIRLAGIAVIRTFLNYFLGKVFEEQREQRKTWDGDAPVFGGSLALATHLAATSMAAKTFTG